MPYTPNSEDMIDAPELNEGGVPPVEQSPAETEAFAEQVAQTVAQGNAATEKTPDEQKQIEELTAELKGEPLPPPPEEINIDPMEIFKHDIERSKQTAAESLGKIQGLRDTIVSANVSGELFITQDINGSPKVELRKSNSQQASGAEAEFVQSLEEFLSSIDKVTTKLPNEDYPDKSSGHSLRLLWQKNPGPRSPKQILDQTEHLLNVATQESFGIKSA